MQKSVWGRGAVADSWHLTCNGQDLKRKVRGALEEQYKKRKDAESSEPSISDWALWKFANSPPEELTDDSKFPVSSAIQPRSMENHLTLPLRAYLECAAQNLEAAQCTDSDCYIGVEHPDKHRYVRCSLPCTSLLFRFLCSKPHCHEPKLAQCVCCQGDTEERQEQPLCPAGVSLGATKVDGQTVVCVQVNTMRTVEKAIKISR